MGPDGTAEVERSSRRTGKSLSIVQTKRERLLVIYFIFVVSIIAITPVNGQGSSILRTFDNPSAKIELLRGFRAALFATNDFEQAQEWKKRFDQAMSIGARNGTNSQWFVLGAELGFSFKVVEWERLNLPLTNEQARSLVIEGTRARVLYEEGKRVLRISDADILKVVPISRDAFVSWKTSIQASDSDESVVPGFEVIRI